MDQGAMEGAMDRARDGSGCKSWISEQSKERRSYVCMESCDYSGLMMMMMDAMIMMIMMKIMTMMILKAMKSNSYSDKNIDDLSL
jgi:hypothetical protein